MDNLVSSMICYIYIYIIKADGSIMHALIGWLCGNGYDVNMYFYISMVIVRAKMRIMFKSSRHH